MADFAFYINQKDRLVMLESLLDGTGLLISPRINYPTDSPLFLNKATAELLRHFKINPGCYVSGEFSTNPLHMTKMSKGSYAGTYVITGDEGGPVMSLTLVEEQKVDGEDLLVPSHLTYQPHIWNETQTNVVPQNDGLKEAFKRVRRILMGHCKKMKLPSQTWVGHSAVGDFESGQTWLLYKGKRIKSGSI